MPKFTAKSRLVASSLSRWFCHAVQGHPAAHATHTCFNFFYGLCFTLRWMCFSKTTVYWNLGLYGFQVQLSPDCEFLLLEDDGVV